MKNVRPSSDPKTDPRATDPNQSRSRSRLPAAPRDRCGEWKSPSPSRRRMIGAVPHRTGSPPTRPARSSTGLQIEGRAADHPQHLARHGVPFKGPRAAPKTSRVFSMAMTAWGRKVLNQLDLLVGEGADILAVDRQ